MKFKISRNKIQKNSQKRIAKNQFDIDFFLKTGKLEIKKEEKKIEKEKEKDKDKELEMNKIKEDNLLKTLRIEKELGLINNGLFKNENKKIYYNQDNDKKNILNENIILFPIIIETNIGIKKNNEIKFEKNENFIELELIFNENIINLKYNNKEFGYITKNISELIYFLSKIKFIQINSYLSSDNNTKIYLIIQLLYNQYGINIKFDDSNKFYSLSFNEKHILGNDCIKILKKLQNISLNTNNNNLNSNFEKKKNELLDFLFSNEFEKDENKNSSFSDYLLNNSERILSIVNSYEFIFDEKDKDFYNKFNELTKEEKNLLLLFMKRTSKWININNLKESNLENLNNLIKKEFIQVFLTQNFNINYNEMFEYLYYFKVEELKNLDNELSKYAKDSKIINSSFLNKNIEEIFLNNPFYNLTKYINSNEINKLLIEDINNISKFITSLNLNKEENKKREIRNVLEEQFSNHFNISKKNKNYNKKYIETFLNYSNFKKVHLNPKLTNLLSSGKNFLVNKIINKIDTYLSDKRSSFLESFININTEQNKSKLENIKKLFNKYNMNFFTLNSYFCKFFDISTRLFFFYSDYKDLNSFGKEFYGIEKFENYKVDEINKIFKEKESFEIYDALYQIRNSYNIYSFFNNNEMNNPISCEKILNILYYHLLIITNQNLVNKLNLNKKSINEEENLKEYNIKLLELLEQLYSNKDLNINEKSFLNKFNSENISSQLLFYLAEISEKIKFYEKSNFIYLFLLNNIENNFILKKRGQIYYRLILNYNHHLKSKKTSITILNLCIENDIKKYNIIKGGSLLKIEKNYNKFKEEKNNKKNKGKNQILNQLTNYNISLKLNLQFLTEITKTIESESLYNKTSGRRIYSIYNENEKNIISTVEEYALSYYNINFNYFGIHGENLIIPSLYNIYLWDCIYYDNLPFVFQSHFQFAPLDFFEKEFYFQRKEIIDKQLNNIENFNINDIYNYISNFFDKKKNIKSPFIDWNNPYISKDILIKISIAMTPKKMVKIFKEILIEGSKYFRRGMPDLFLWKEKKIKKEENNSNYIESIWDSLKLVEVKSTNDKLSEYQIFWLKLLYEKEIQLEVLHIK